MPVRSDRPVPARFRFVLRCALVLAQVAVCVAGGALVVRSARADAGDDEYNLAVGSYSQRRWPLAIESFRRFLAAHPAHPKSAAAKLYLGLSLVGNGDRKEARDVLRTYLKENPQSRNAPDARYRIAECSYLLNEFAVAETEFRTYLEQHPDHAFVEWALADRADALLRLGKAQVAADEYRKSLEKFPRGRRAEDSRFGLARAYEALGKVPEAVEQYKVLAKDPSGALAARAQLNLGARAFEAGKYAEAAREFDDLAARFPESPLVGVARLNGGYAHYEARSYQEAVDRFDQAAKDERQAPKAKYWKALSHRQLGQHDVAAKQLETLFESGDKGPGSEDVLFQWALCERDRKDHAAALRLFVDFADRFPKHASADQGLHYAAEAAFAANDLDATDRLLARFEQEHPRSALAGPHEILAGRALDARGGEERWRKAVGRFELALAASKDSPRQEGLVRIDLARVRQKLGEHEKVVDVLAPVLETLAAPEADPDFSGALVLSSASRAALAKFAESADEAGRYLKLAPQGTDAGQALALRAVALGELGKRTEARADLTALEKRKGDADLLHRTRFRLAEIAYDAEDWVAAADLYDASVRSGAETGFLPRALSGRAWSRYQQKQHAKAAEDFADLAKQFPELDPLAPEAAYMRGKALQDGGSTAEAATAYGECFERFAPVKPAAAGAEKQGRDYYAYRAGLQAARMLRTLKKIDEADAAYDRLATRYPKPEHLDRLFDEWALLNYEAGRFERSDAVFRRLVQETPASELADNARLSLAESDLVSGKGDAARKVFESLETDPRADAEVKQVAGYHLLGQFVERREWKTVRDRATAYLGKFPQAKQAPYARFVLGESLLHLDDPAGARTELTGLIERRAEIASGAAAWFPRTWVLAAESAFRLKKYDEVESTVDAFRVADPQSPFLYQADEVLGRAYKNKADFDKARAVFGRVTEDASGRRTETAAKCQFLIAETHLLEKNHEAALREYLKVRFLYKFPEWQAPALFQAAQCDEALGHWKEAVATYEELLRDFPTSEFAAKGRPKLEAARKRAGS